MTDNTKQEANTANKLPKGNSIFQRIVKTNMARTAAILALMSAVPLMESKAGPWDALKRTKNQTLNLENFIAPEEMAAGVENIGDGESLGSLAGNVAWGTLDVIGKSIAAIPQFTLDLTRFSGQKIQYLGKQIDEHPFAAICLGGFAVGVLLATRYREFLSFTELGKLKNNSKIIDRCTEELNSMWVEGDKVLAGILGDMNKFSGSNLNIGNSDLNFKKNLEDFEKQINNCNERIKEINGLKERVDKVHDLYKQTMNNVDRKVINVVAMRKDPGQELFYKGLVEGVEKAAIGNDNKSIFDQLNAVLDDFKKIEEEKSFTLRIAMNPVNKNLFEVQKNIVSKFNTTTENYKFLILRISSLEDCLKRLGRHNKALKTKPEPSNGGLGVWNKLASLIRR